MSKRSKSAAQFNEAVRYSEDGKQNYFQFVRAFGRWPNKCRFEMNGFWVFELIRHVVDRRLRQDEIERLASLLEQIPAEEKVGRSSLSEPEVLAQFDRLQARFQKMLNKAQVVQADWLSVDDAAVQVEREPWTVRQWCVHGRINARKLGVRSKSPWRIHVSEIKRFLEQGLLPADKTRNAGTTRLH